MIMSVLHRIFKYIFWFVTGRLLCTMKQNKIWNKVSKERVTNTDHQSQNVYSITLTSYIYKG